jgi:hypothetical protein
MGPLDWCSEGGCLGRSCSLLVLMTHLQVPVRTLVLRPPRVAGQVERTWGTSVNDHWDLYFASCLSGTVPGQPTEAICFASACPRGVQVPGVAVKVALGSSSCPIVPVGTLRPSGGQAHLVACCGLEAEPHSPHPTLKLSPRQPRVGVIRTTTRGWPDPSALLLVPP